MGVQPVTRNPLTLAKKIFEVAWIYLFGILNCILDYLMVS